MGTGPRRGREEVTRSTQIAAINNLCESKTPRDCLHCAASGSNPHAEVHADGAACTMRCAMCVRQQLLAGGPLLTEHAVWCPLSHIQRQGCACQGVGKHSIKACMLCCVRGCECVGAQLQRAVLVPAAANAARQAAAGLVAVVVNSVFHALVPLGCRETVCRPSRKAKQAHMRMHGSTVLHGMLVQGKPYGIYGIYGLCGLHAPRCLQHLPSPLHVSLWSGDQAEEAQCRIIIACWRRCHDEPARESYSRKAWMGTTTGGH